MVRRPRGPGFAVLSGLLALLAACASTPQATHERDREAKQFGTHPASATLYVYRLDSGAEDSALWINERLIGATLPYTYFRVHLDPGRHTLSGVGADNGRLTLDVRAGALYFVALTVQAGQSFYQPVPQRVGREVVAKCCHLLENWAPAQRPLLW